MHAYHIDSEIFLPFWGQGLLFRLRLEHPFTIQIEDGVGVGFAYAMNR